MTSMIDHITSAMAHRDERFPNMPQWNRAGEYFDHNRSALSPQFDLFLVRMGDPLAKEPGTPRDRFCARVCRMAELSSQTRRAEDAQLAGNA